MVNSFYTIMEALDANLQLLQQYQALSLGPDAKVVENADIIATIIAYLSRKRKFELRQVNRFFRDTVIPRCFVSLKFYLTRTLEHEAFTKML